MTVQPVMVLNGPNLSRLGRREPGVYGTKTLSELESELVSLGNELGLQVQARQTDDEATMIKWLHEAADGSIPVIINPAAWTHYNYAIADAVAQCDAGVFEVHLTNVHAREGFRRTSVISPVATAVIAGLGAEGYELALIAVANRMAITESPAGDEVSE